MSSQFLTLSWLYVSTCLKSYFAHCMLSIHPKNSTKSTSAINPATTASTKNSLVKMWVPNIDQWITDVLCFVFSHFKHFVQHSKQIHCISVRSASAVTKSWTKAMMWVSNIVTFMTGMGHLTIAVGKKRQWMKQHCMHEQQRN